MRVFTAGIRVRCRLLPEQEGTVVAACSPPPSADPASGPWYRVRWDGHDEGFGEACDLEAVT